MGAESSKDNSRFNTPEQNRRQNHRPRQYVYEEASPAYTVTSPSSPQQTPVERSRNPYNYTTQDLQNTNQPNQPKLPERSQNPYSYSYSTRDSATTLTNQPNTFERSRNPYNYTTQDLNTTKPVNQPNTLERAPQPYNFSTEELRNGGPAKAQNLYPNLNLNRSQDGFVVVPNFGQQRSSPQPSAPPATALNTPPVNRSTATQQSTPSNNASRPSNSANSSTDKNTSRPKSAASARRKDALSCPTCSKRLGITIYQCSQGHSSCKECRLANKDCGTCLASITDLRNIMLEAYIAELSSTCQNQGCTLSFNAEGMERHLKECPFGEMDCPMGTFFGQCSTRCKVADLAAHFDAFHKDQRTAEIDKEMYVFNICMDTHKMYLVKNGPYTFLVHVKVSETERKIYMTIQLLGTKISADKWKYEFHVYNKRQPLRKFLYMDSCQWIGNPVDDIFRENQCATLPVTYAMTFVNESALTYKFFIKKEMNQRARKGPRNARNTAN